MIRKARQEDLDGIMSIYARARDYMCANGNPTQWEDGWPSRQAVEKDLLLDRLYVFCAAGSDTPHGVFALKLDAEEAYRHIDGAWLNERPYGVIHRLASDGTVHGIFAACVDFCKTLCPELRADTHANNRTMQHLLVKCGFVRCGVVDLGIGGDSLRIAYQYKRSQ